MHPRSMECFDCFPGYYYVITHEKGVSEKSLNLSRELQGIRARGSRVRDEPTERRSEKKQW